MKRFALGLALVALLAAAPTAAGEDSTLEGTKVLFVSPVADRDETGWIPKLLEAHGAEVRPAAWSEAGVERARAFDLVVVAGRGGQIGAKDVPEYDRPVLGVGPYGHHYFGQFQLKHGFPHS